MCSGRGGGEGRFLAFYPVGKDAYLLMLLITACRSLRYSIWGNLKGFPPFLPQAHHTIEFLCPLT
jgi:hypothetical protein